MEADIKKTLEVAEQHMKRALEFFEKEIAKLRAGRVTPALIEDIKVECYGTKMAINQIATISVADARTIVVKPWDKNILEVVERAFREANLGATISNDGEQVRLTFPPLSEESRQQYIRKLNQYAEQARVSIRNARREALDALRHKKKESLSEDEFKRWEAQLEKLTHSFIDKVDKIAHSKEQQLKSV